MPWIVEKIEHPAWTAKYGPELQSTDRFDPYEMSLVIEDMGDGIALLSSGSGGKGVVPRPKELIQKLRNMGFQRMRWVRVVDENLSERL